MKRRRFLTVLAAVPLAQIAAQLPASGPTVINVRDFGAVGDGFNDDSDAFQRAIEASLKNPDAMIHVPPGSYNLDRGLADGRFSITDRMVDGRWVTQ